MKVLATLAISLLLVVASGCSKPAEQSAPKTQVSATNPARSVKSQGMSGQLDISPSEVKVDQNATLRFTLSDEKGQAIRDAMVRATLTMPMGKSQMKEELELKWDGSAYSGNIKAMMAGTWDVAVEAKRDGKTVLSLPTQIDAR